MTGEGAGEGLVTEIGCISENRDKWKEQAGKAVGLSIVSTTYYLSTEVPHDDGDVCLAVFEPHDHGLLGVFEPLKGNLQ